MARSLWCFTPVVLLVFINNVGKCVDVILEDPHTFKETENFNTDGAELTWSGSQETQRVAFYSNNTWNPDDYYGDRVHANSSVQFTRTVFTDTGLYELTYVSGEIFKTIQLDVIVPHVASAKEGDRFKLGCYYHTVVHTLESVNWTKNGKIVCVRNFSSNEDKYGTGYKGNVSMAAGGKKEGDLSLILEQVEMKDEGDYRCHVTPKEGRTRIDAVRLRVEKRDPDHCNGTAQNLTPTGPEDRATGTGCNIGLIVAIVFMLFACVGAVGCLLTSCCSKRSHVAAGRADESLPLSTALPPPLVNGNSPLNSQADSCV